MRKYEGVEPSIWQLTGDLCQMRRERLENAVSGAEIATQIQSQAKKSAEAAKIKLEWERSCEQDNYYRIIAQIPLPDKLFDQFFNGRTGYRAQYYRSPCLGEEYNALIIENLVGSIRVAFSKNNNELEQPWEDIEVSLMGSWTKLWVAGDGQAFDEAVTGLKVQRWCEYWKDKPPRGLKTPCPSGRQLDLKGTFITLDAKKEFVDKYKLCRSLDIYRSGWS